ncbi:cobalamin biosynthesis protein [Pseudaminobacter sp. NGMCC 1.201702]|uniref:cobalamin biosynthesis protein n=1 Tax=Pseudaminobacter sp. NGMCC 1.201702 TaxID=3391825 RepID=UPI0039F14B1B
MIFAGIGSRKGVSEQQVLSAISAALAEYRLDLSSLGGLATASLKRDETAIHSAARQLGLPLIIVDDTDLARAGTETPSRSELSLTLTGVASVSEAAALAAAGEGARLLGPRLLLDSVTCALAISGEVE